MLGGLAGFIDGGYGELSSEAVGHGSPVNHLAVDEDDIYFNLAFIMVPLLILHAVRRESKFYFGHGVKDVAAKARIPEERLPPIQLWNEINRAEVGDILNDFDILFVRSIVRVIDIDMIVTFLQIDGEVAT